MKTVVRIYGVLLYFAALFLFAVNLWFELSGQHLSLHTTTGATILTGFLVLGTILQLARLWVGHDSAPALVVTIGLLLLHIVADLAVWGTTQILQRPLPANIPLIIIGVYWVVGVADITGQVVRREFQLFKRGYEPEDRRLARELAEARQAAALAEKEAELVKEYQAKTERQLIALQSQSNRTATVATVKQPEYKGTCSDCGQELVSTSQRGLTNAFNAHKRFCPGKAAQSNGHRHERTEVE
jgi:signal transduction histidine kinase